MAAFLSLQCSQNPHPAISISTPPANPLNKYPKRVKIHNTLYSNSSTSFSLVLNDKTQVGFAPIGKKIDQSLNCSTSGSGLEPEPKPKPEGEVDDIGVKAALSMLNFYKREISPLLPKSCRYVPTCSEYSMIAYKKYGVVKGTVLTAWRLCRCNPLGGSGFDPPRWFGEDSALEDEESEDF